MWLNVLRQSYYKLLAIGMGALAIYLAGMYFLISPDINIEKLQAPLFMLGFSFVTAPDGGDSSGEGLLAAACDDFLDFV